MPVNSESALELIPKNVEGTNMIALSSKGTIATIFERAIDFEYKAADAYKEFSELFLHIREIFSFWNDLAEDETQHAETLQKICNSLTSKQLLSPCGEDLSRKVDRTLQLVEQASTASIKNLDDAYELAHELEFSEANTIFKLLTNKFIHSQEGKEFIISQLSEHQQKLVEFPDNFGGRDWREGIPVNHV